jgi:Domain of unknown function (DUF6089)
MLGKSFHIAGLMVLILVLIAPKTSAQRSLYRRTFIEVKVSAGTSMFLGDLGGSTGKGKVGIIDLDLSSIRQNISAGLKLNLSNRIAIRGDIFNGRLSGDDRNSGDEQRRIRNLSFQTSISELSVTAEYVAINLSRFGNKKMNTSELYTFAGFGWIHFNPKAFYKGTWYELQPLGTEGQGIIPDTKFYSLNSVVVPFGLGFRKNVGNKTFIGLEISMRKTFTDNIDDVSGNYADKELIRESYGDMAAALSDRSEGENNRVGTARGNAGQNDNYSFVQLTFARGFGKRLAKEKIGFSFIKSLGAHTLKCPDFK